MIKLKAFAKINWILNIVGVCNGFHMLDGVMECVSLYDIITMEIKDAPGVTTDYNTGVVEGDLCKRAAEAFYDRTGIQGGVAVTVEKNIPMGAGLGGGSSDCGGVLCGLNEYYGEPLTKEELKEIGAGLGADVAFFVEGGAQRAKGKGEILSPVPRETEFRIILARPKGDGVSTPKAFALYDSMEKRPRGDVDGMINALIKGDETAVGEYMFNGLEAPSEYLLPEIRQVKERVIKAGAINAVMTGSGSAVIGILPKDGTVNERALDGLWYRICVTEKKSREIIK